MYRRDHARPHALLGARSALIAGAIVTALCVPAMPALAQTGKVSPNPEAGTPTLVDTGTTETIRQLADCGGTMYAVGTFTEISGYNGTTTQTFTRNNIFSFSETAPFTVTSWDPNVNGTVNTIAFNNGNCADAYIGGQFTTVGGAAAKNMAEISTATGALVPGFKDNAGGQVETILAVDGHLLTGGFFKGISGSTAGYGQGRRVRSPEHLRPHPVPGREEQLHGGLQPAVVPWRHAGPGGG